MCQGCVDNGHLQQTTCDLIQAFLREWPDAEYGPGHIVLSDDNVEDGHITWCIALAKAALSRNPADLEVGDRARDIEMMDKLHWYEDSDPEELRATITFFESLLAIPESAR